MAQIFAVVCTILMLAASLSAGFDCWLFLSKGCQIGEEKVECRWTNSGAKKTPNCGTTVIVVEGGCSPGGCSGNKPSPCRPEQNRSEPDCGDSKSHPCCVLAHRDVEGLRWEPEVPVAKLPEIPRLPFNRIPEPSTVRIEGIQPINIHPTIATTVLLM